MANVHVGIFGRTIVYVGKNIPPLPNNIEIKRNSKLGEKPKPTRKKFTIWTIVTITHNNFLP